MSSSRPGACGGGYTPFCPGQSGVQVLPAHAMCPWGRSLKCSKLPVFLTKSESLLRVNSSCVQPAGIWEVLMTVFPAALLRYNPYPIKIARVECV